MTKFETVDAKSHISLDADVCRRDWGADEEGVLYNLTDEVSHSEEFGGHCDCFVDPMR